MCDSAKKPQRIIKDFLNALFCFGSFEEPHLFCVLMLKDNLIYTTW